MKRLLLIIILSIPATSFAGWTAGYTVLDLDLGDGDSLSLGAINASYKWNSDDSDFSTELGVLLPVQDDKLYGVTLELDTSIYLKGMYNINENVFIAATWGRYGAKASGPGGSVSGSEFRGRNWNWF